MEPQKPNSSWPGPEVVERQRVARSPDSRFYRGTTRLISWPDGKRYLHPLQSLVVSLLLSLVSILLFSQTGGVPSHRNSSTHKFPRPPLRNLCSLLLLFTRPLPRDGAWQKTTEPQKPGNSPGSGSEIVERQRVAKE